MGWLRLLETLDAPDLPTQTPFPGRPSGLAELQ